MKKSLFAITLAGIIMISGVLAVTAEESIETMGVKIQKTETAGQTEEEDSFVVEVVDDTKIVTPYYSIMVPDTWIGNYSIDVVSNITGMWLKFHFGGEERGQGGHLFSILLDNTEEYKKIADYDLLGELEDGENNVYHVVAVFPTDVQFTMEEKDSYLKMSDDAESILDTIEAAEGCTYTKEDKKP